MRPKRPLLTGNPLRLLVVMGLVTIGAVGCGSDPTEPEFNPDFMVGNWLADSLVMTSVANPDVVADLTALGAVFTLSVQPSGRYTAILEGFGQSSSESGRLTVDGAYVVLMPESPRGRSRKPCGREWVSPSSWRVRANSTSISTARPKRPRSDRCWFPTSLVSQKTPH